MHVYVCTLILVSSISEPAHFVYSGVVHKSDFVKMKHVKCSWCFGGCLKWRAIPPHIARTQTPLGVAELSLSMLISIHFKNHRGSFSSYSISITKASHLACSIVGSGTFFKKFEHLSAIAGIRLYIPCSRLVGLCCRVILGKM